MNQYLVAWSCRDICGTKLKSLRALVSCRMLSCRVVSSMCELAFRVKAYPHRTRTARRDATRCDAIF